MLYTFQRKEMEELLRVGVECLEDAYDILHSSYTASPDNAHARHDMAQLAKAIKLVEEMQQAK